MPILIDLIEKRRLWYDLPDGVFYLFQLGLIAVCLFLLPSLGVDMAFAVILLFAFVLVSSAVLSRRFGQWVRNYTVTGTIKIRADQVVIETGNDSRAFTINKIQQVYVETNYWQNYTGVKGGTYSGIGFLKLYPFSAAPFSLYFILYDKEQHDRLIEVRNSWEEFKKLRLYN